jgi:very-short-patch-repair endonuclease
MFLSMVAAPNERIGALVKESDKQRFNVAASRARDQLWLFHSCTLNDLNPECLRHRLLSYMMNPERAQENLPQGLDVATLRRLAASSSRREGTQPAPFDSWFEIDVFLELVERGYRVIPQYQVSSYHIDLVVEGFRTRLAVECDGDIAHPPEKWEQDAYRQRVLERCGWTFWRLRGSEFYRDPGTALRPLWEKLAQMDILPGAKPSVRQESESRIAAEATAAQGTLRAYEEAPDTASESLGDPEASDRDIEKEGARFDEQALPFSVAAPPRSEPRRMQGSRPICKQRTSAQQPDPTPDDLANMEWAATIPAAVWFSMSHWAKVENQLVGWERSLLFSLGNLASRGLKPSVKQARHARRLYDTARKLGFSEDT